MQEKTNSKISKSLIIAICAGALALVFLLVYFLAVFKAPTRGKDKLTLEILYGNTTYSYNIKTDLQKDEAGKVKTTIADILQQQNTPLNLKFEYSNGDYGMYMTSIKNTASTDTHFYLFYINNTDTQLGISEQTVSAGDKITIKFGIPEYSETSPGVWEITKFELKDGKKLLDVGQTLFYPVIVISVFLVGFAALEINNHFRLKKLAEKKQDGQDASV